jgi:hypothetical protein
VTLEDTQGNFDVSAPVAVANTGAAALAEYQLVDNSKYRYAILASATNAAQGAHAQINTLQVTCNRF